jgi:hypothetical protein
MRCESFDPIDDYRVHNNFIDDYRAHNISGGDYYRDHDQLTFVNDDRTAGDRIFDFRAGGASDNVCPARRRSYDTDDSLVHDSARRD